MTRKRHSAPAAQAWSAFATALMRCEWTLEQRSTRGAWAARWRELEREAAFRWLVAQPAYSEALAAYQRRVGDSETLRFELVSAIGYAMDLLHARSAQATRKTVARQKQALRHARALARLIGEASAADDDGQSLLVPLERYIAHREEALRAFAVTRRDPPPQLRFGRDVARVLWTTIGSAPSDVIAPLVRLAGPEASSRRIASLIVQARREAQRIEEGTEREKPRYVLDRIVIKPTPSTSRPQRTAR